MKPRTILYLCISVPVFIVLVWFFAVPSDMLKEQIEASVAQAGKADINASILGFRKGLFLTVHADSIDLKVNNIPAMNIDDISVNFAPVHLIRGDVAFRISGKIGAGNVHGLVKLPPKGEITIEEADLEAVPYLTRFGMKISGLVFSKILIEQNAVKVIFEVPDLNIDESTSVIPLLSTFRRLQGGLSVKGNVILIDSISLEGDKGYARLKGAIRNNVMDMVLEVMPVAEKLNTIESMLIGKYIVSPGYYVIPVTGPLRQDF